MNYSHKHKFIWVAPFKVASRATADFFRQHSDLNPHLPTDDNPGMIFTHTQGWPEECPSDYSYIVNVRHPYYRWISYWKHDLNDTTELKPNTPDPLTALKGVTDERCNAWSEWRIISDYPIDYIIHAESVEEDLRKLPFVGGDVEIEFTKRNKRPTAIPAGTDWDVEELRELVYDKFRQDYDNLGYGKWDDFDHIWDCSPNPIEETRPVKTFPTKI